jgi:ATP-binding protein involved in chromosome partitioning
MSKLSSEVVLESLKSVKDPELGRDVVSLNMIKDLKVNEDGAVSLTLELTTPACPIKGEFQEAVRQAVLKTGAKEVVVNLSSNMAKKIPFQISGKEEILPGVKYSIAVASGKGGVGKSTVASNLAVALVQEGAKVGILDADIYGPTIPFMMNISEQTPQVHNGRLAPLLQYGCKVMSMGLILPKGEAVVWRGPMVAKMVHEFVGAVEWGDLDYLLIDLPPGTGDAALTVAQLIPLSGVVVVTTPQEAATRIAAKAISMFGKLKAPIIGVVENMSYYECPSCHHKEEIFGNGGGEMASRENGVPFLGKIPLHPLVRESGDEGKPVVVFDPALPASRAFREVAGKMAGRLSVLKAGLPVLTPVSS